MLGHRSNSRTIDALPRPPQNKATLIERPHISSLQYTSLQNTHPQHQLAEADITNENKTVAGVAEEPHAALAAGARAVLDIDLDQRGAAFEKLRGYLGRIIEAL